VGLNSTPFALSHPSEDANGPDRERFAAELCAVFQHFHPRGTTATPYNALSGEVQTAWLKVAEAALESVQADQSALEKAEADLADMEEERDEHEGRAKVLEAAIKSSMMLIGAAITEADNLEAPERLKTLIVEALTALEKTETE
jgi:hypothetical protein